MQDKYMIVISFDAVSSKDIDFLRNLPNFKEIILKGALIKNVETITPSLTYPAHVSIVTGKYPKNHGITSNTVFDIGEKNPNWNWYGNKIKGDTIFHVAKKAGLKTCSILWPVTGKMNIDYNMPEIFCTKPWHNQLVMSALAGTLKYQYLLNSKFGHIREGTKQPNLDNYTLECTKYTIENIKPNLLFVHLIDVDNRKHEFGCNSKEALEALKNHDFRLGEIIKSLKKAKIYENTTLVALGDHSAINVNNIIRINKLFADNKLLTLKKGKIKNYKAIAKSCDGSCYIYIKEDKYKSIVKNLLQKLMDKKVIEFIFDKNEVIKLGADPNCDFMLEAAKGYYFLDEPEGEIIDNTETNIGNFHIYRATHGYWAKKENYKTFFIASGKGIKKGIELDSGRLINHAPTFAKILGLNMKDIDGKVVNEILEFKDNYY